MLGWAAFRRSALGDAGGFDTQLIGEDVAATAALVARGWRTRFAPAAVAADRVVTSLADYRRQRARWQRASSTPAARRRPRRPGAWSPCSQRPGTPTASRFWPRSAWPQRAGRPPGSRRRTLALRGLEVVVALRKAGAGSDSADHLFWTAALFPVDVATSVAGIARGLRRRSGGWQSPAREEARA